MTSPQDTPPTWASPGGGGAPRPPAPDDERTPPAPAATPDAPAAPPTASAPLAPPAAPPVGPPVAPPVGPPVAPPVPTGWGGAPAYGPRPGYGAPPPAGYGQAPAGYGPPPAYGTPPPGYGPPHAAPPPGYGPPGAPAPVGAPPVYGPPGGWRMPVTQPGIIPLRPLGLGEILDGAFRAVRANPSVMFGLAVLVMTVAVGLQALLSWYLGGQLTGVIGDLDSSSLYDDGTADALANGFAQFATFPITTIATSVLTGLLVVSVSRSVLGRKVSISEVLRSRRVWAVVGFTFLTGIAMGLGIGVLVGAVWLLATSDQPGPAVLVAFVGGIGLVVAAVWVSVRTLLVTPALMLEERRFWPTVARAWRLTRGSFWRLLGIYLLTSIMVGIAAQIIVYPTTIVALLVFHDPLSLGAVAITSVGEVIAQTLTTVFLSSVVALLYIDVRMRREGLDLELARAAAADQPA